MFFGMQKSHELILVLLLIAAAATIYLARPTETAHEYAHRRCTESPTIGVSYETCVDGRTLQRRAGRQDDER